MKCTTCGGPRGAPLRASVFTDTVVGRRFRQLTEGTNLETSQLDGFERTNETFTGRCLCGAVSYTCDAAAVFQFNCHCRDCQRSTGCAFASILFVPRSALHVQGALTYYTSQGGSGQSITRGFCGICGAQVLGDAQMVAPLISLRAGTLDDPSVFRPKADVCVGHAAAWVAMNADLPKFQAMPMRPSEM